MHKQQTFPSNRPWSIESVQHLRSLANEKVAAPVIAMILKRPETEIHAKASELGFSLRLN
jgi:ribosomal protein L32E